MANLGLLEIILGLLCIIAVLAVVISLVMVAASMVTGDGRRGPSGRAHQPRSRHPCRCGRSSPSVVSDPWPG